MYHDALSSQDLLNQNRACRSVEDSHMKTNLVHTLYQVQKFGTMELEKFADLLKPREKKRCLANKDSKKWYSISQEVFMSFIFRVRVFHLESLETPQIPVQKFKLLT